MTTATMDKAFEQELKKEGLERSGPAKWPFLPFKDAVGNWVIGTILDSREVKFKPKNGKNKNKEQETTYFTLQVEKSNIKGVEAGGTYTVSPTGLLLYQLTENAKKLKLSIPFKVAIRYMGRDDEERHQTEVSYPKA